jgi:hypothetical protein
MRQYSNHFYAFVNGRGDEGGILSLVFADMLDFQFADSSSWFHPVAKIDFYQTTSILGHS